MVEGQLPEMPIQASINGMATAGYFLSFLPSWHGMAWHGMAWHGMAWHESPPTPLAMVFIVWLLACCSDQCELYSTRRS
jgi:hypothetical protein